MIQTIVFYFQTEQEKEREEKDRKERLKEILALGNYRENMINRNYEYLCNYLGHPTKYTNLLIEMLAKDVISDSEKQNITVSFHNSYNLNYNSATAVLKKCSIGETGAS